MNRLLWPFAAFLIFCASSVTHSADLEPLWNAGNAAYEKGDFIEAQKNYQALVRNGAINAKLFYNLGNVFYKQGQRGKAILWYERALELDPRDKDVRFNLTLAQSHIKEGGDHWARRLAQSLTLNELGLTALVLAWIFFGALGLFFLGKLKGETSPIFILWTSAILLVLSSGWFGWALWDQHQPRAIVISPPGEVRNGPGLEYAVGFTVPQGTKLLVLNKRPDWSQVGAPQEGLKGWIPTKDIEEIGNLDSDLDFNAWDKTYSKVGTATFDTSDKSAS